MKAGKILLATFIVFFLIIGFSTVGAAKDKLEFAFVTNGPYTFWTFAHAGVLKAEKDYNVKVHFYKPPSGAPEEQKRFIETMLAKKIDGLAWCVVDPDNMTPFLNQVAKRIPVITFDSDAIESDRLAYVGMSSYAAGRMCGKGIMHELPDGIGCRQTHHTANPGGGCGIRDVLIVPEYRTNFYILKLLY